MYATDPNLFHANRFPRHQQACVPPKPVNKDDFDTQRRLVGESIIAQETAELACEHWGDNKDLCVYDVIAMGDLEVAQAGVY